MLQYMPEFSSFLRLNNIPVHMYTSLPVCSSINENLYTLEWLGRSTGRPGTAEQGPEGRCQELGSLAETQSTRALTPRVDD